MVLLFGERWGGFYLWALWQILQRKEKTSFSSQKSTQRLSPSRRRRIYVLAMLASFPWNQNFRRTYYHCARTWWVEISFCKIIFLDVCSQLLCNTGNKKLTIYIYLRFGLKFNSLYSGVFVSRGPTSKHNMEAMFSNWHPPFLWWNHWQPTHRRYVHTELCSILWKKSKYNKPKKTRWYYQRISRQENSSGNCI